MWIIYIYIYRFNTCDILYVAMWPGGRRRQSGNPEVVGLSPAGGYPNPNTFKSFHPS